MAGSQLLDPDVKVKRETRSLATSELTALLLLHVIRHQGRAVSREQLQHAFRDLLRKEAGRTGFISLDGHDSVWDFLGEMRLRDRVTIQNGNRPPLVGLTDRGRGYTETYSEDEIKQALNFALG